jgi:hypothetical protein
LDHPLRRIKAQADAVLAEMDAEFSTTTRCCASTRCRAQSCASVMRRVLILLVFAVPAFAQEQDIQRALIQRDQQSASFALQLQQSQQKDTSNHLAQRHRLDNVSAQQIQSVAKDTPQELRPYERQKAADERVLLFAPPMVRMLPPEKPRPLPAQMPQAVAPVAPVAPAY